MDKSTMQRMVDKSHEEYIVGRRKMGVNKDGTCVYFFEDGTPACVLGLFLPLSFAERLKTGHMNDCSINALLKSRGMQDILRQDSATTIDELFDERGIRFLTALQRAHDRSTTDDSGGEGNFRTRFDVGLRELSVEFELNYPLTLAA